MHYEAMMVKRDVNKGLGFPHNPDMMPSLSRSVRPEFELHCIFHHNDLYLHVKIHSEKRSLLSCVWLTAENPVQRV